MQVLSSIGMQAMGDIFHYAGIFGSLILMGFGGWWLGIALLTTLKHRKDLPFNLGWWGLTFPLGVFSLAILNLGQQLALPVFCHVAYGLASILILLWVVVASKTTQGFYHGNLFFSPCLKAYLEKN